MLANFLNKSKPINFISLIIFFFIGFTYQVFSVIFLDGFTLDKLLKSAILVVLFISVFFFYNFIVSKNKLTFDNSYAYFIFTILTICNLSEIINYKSLILAILYMLFLRKIYSLRTAKEVVQKLFDSGFLLGILFILEPLSILFLIVLFTAIYLHQKITIHTIFTPIIGFVTPVFVYFTYFFWFDKTEVFTQLFDFNINFDFHFYSTPKYFWLLTIGFAISLFSIFAKSLEALGISNTFRRSWILLITNFIIVLLFILLTPVKNGSELIFMLFPASVIIANGIELIQKKIIKNLILYTVFLGGIFLSFFL